MAQRDSERVERVTAALAEAGWDALICTLPQNVLLLSGYWPVLGQSAAIINRDGRIVVVAPEDEEDIARDGWADDVRGYAAASLSKIQNSVESLRGPLADAVHTMKLGSGAMIGFENGAAFVPQPYASTHVYGAALENLLGAAIPGANLKPAAEVLKRLRRMLTPGELAKVRIACEIGMNAFQESAKLIHVGMSETRVANLVRAFLSSDGALRLFGGDRVGGQAWCMSGPNSAEGYKAFQRSSGRAVELGDLALVHCNSQAGGFWTDISRTFCLGAPDKRKQAMYEAAFAASRAAIEFIRPGVKGRSVDKAARDEMEARGFEKEFKHPTGHGAGFVAINHNAQPRLHPVSEDVLETGMVFNVETGVYIENYGGIRQCDMVTVTESGAESLTPFMARMDDLVLG